MVLDTGTTWCHVAKNWHQLTPPLTSTESLFKRRPLCLNTALLQCLQCQIFCPGAGGAVAVSELFDYSVRWHPPTTTSAAREQIVLTSYCKNHKIWSIFWQQPKNWKCLKLGIPQPVDVSCSGCWVKVYNHCLLFNISQPFYFFDGLDFLILVKQANKSNNLVWWVCGISYFGRILTTTHRGRL